MNTIALTVQKIQNGEMSEFSTLFQETHNKTYFLALNMINNEEDALDITQETYVQAFTQIQTLKDPRAVMSWLNTITRNLCYSFLRKKKPLLCRDDNEYDKIFIKPDENEEFCPESAVEKSEVRKILLSLLDKLPENQKEIILLADYQQLSMAAISDMLCISESAAKSRLHRAHKKLRELVEQKEEEGVKIRSLLLPIPILKQLLQEEAFENKLNPHKASRILKKAAKKAGVSMTKSGLETTGPNFSIIRKMSEMLQCIGQSKSFIPFVTKAMQFCLFFIIGIVFLFNFIIPRYIMFDVPFDDKGIYIDVSKLYNGYPAAVKADSQWDHYYDYDKEKTVTTNPISTERVKKVQTTFESAELPNSIGQADTTTVKTLSASTAFTYPTDPNDNSVTGSKEPEVSTEPTTEPNSTNTTSASTTTESTGQTGYTNSAGSKDPVKSTNPTGFTDPTESESTVTASALTTTESIDLTDLTEPSDITTESVSSGTTAAHSSLEIETTTQPKYTRKIYIDTTKHSSWNEFQAKIYAYFSGKDLEEPAAVWIEGKKEPGSAGLYSFEVSEKFEFVTFTRMNPDNLSDRDYWEDEHVSDTVWNKTVEIEIPPDKNTFYLYDGYPTEGKANGQWDPYENEMAAATEEITSVATTISETMESKEDTNTTEAAELEEATELEKATELEETTELEEAADNIIAEHKNIRVLMDGYYNCTDNYSGQLDSNDLVWSIESLSDSSARSGINVDESGKVEIDKDVLLGTTFNVKAKSGNDCEIWNIEVILPVSETFFPDEAFMKYIDGRSGGRHTFTKAQAEAIKTMDANNKNIASVQGIKYFTDITSLNFNDNQLTELDVSENTELKNISCGRNQLTGKLDLSNNTNLTGIYVPNNQLTELDISKSINMQKITFYNNKLTKLDITNNVNLINIDGRGNLLTELDTSKNTALEVFECGPIVAHMSRHKF